MSVTSLTTNPKNRYKEFFMTTQKFCFTCVILLRRLTICYFEYPQHSRVQLFDIALIFVSASFIPKGLRRQFQQPVFSNKGKFVAFAEMHIKESANGMMHLYLDSIPSLSLCLFVSFHDYRYCCLISHIPLNNCNDLLPLLFQLSPLLPLAFCEICCMLYRCLEAGVHTCDIMLNIYDVLVFPI